MAFRVLEVHDSLSDSSRFRAMLRREPKISSFEMLVIAAAGTAAAMLSSVDLPDLLGSITGVYPKVPGYTILRTFLPMSLGLALVPRRMAATLIGAIALVVALTLNQLDWANIGEAAICSLAVTGPVFDVAVWNARSSYRLYAGFVFAGVTSNFIAFVIHGVNKARTGRQGGMIWADWKWRAAITYPVAGAIVCLVCAIVWFRYSSPRDRAFPEAA